MFGNILVHIPTELSARSAVNGSISLAVSTKAQLDAMAIGYERTIIPLIASAGTAVTSIFEVEHARALERAEAALRVFELESRNSDIRYTTRALSAIPTDGRGIICASARLHDLTIVTQPQRDHDSYDNVIPQEILFQAAGPVLFMPHTFYGAFSAKRIGIRWDGSRLAARALRDAMPLLREADALTIITITGPDAMPAESSTEHVLRYLARSGLPAKVASVAASEVQPALQSIAADEGLDLMVMSGYHYSWPQEKLLGHATRKTLQAMTIPVLTSH
ncbi:universal stress protein [Bradyrhizobium sp. INPA03-11B]|uniref:universal stress protein n=1 Tax=Bradyrhizobium sp. INPA03-11B TaxID=418598 RepID=UPI00338F5482